MGLCEKEKINSIIKEIHNMTTSKRKHNIIISEMIEKLKEIKEKEGDLPIYYPNLDYGWEEECFSIDLCEKDHDWKGEETGIEYPKRVLIQ